MNISKMENICPYKLNETYDTLFELQERLNISDEYLLNTSINSELDREYKEPLEKLLDASLKTRDNLVTWYLKQTLVELNASISLLTSKIKFIEYKLGRCDGLDLHQACSLSLVNFCNILTDLSVHNNKTTKRKMMHQVSTEINIPIWLSHYRNQICHMPSESPCIGILVPLVIKSLNYMKESFWSKLIEKNHFDYERCDKLIRIISSNTNIESINQNVTLKRNLNLSKKQRISADKSVLQCSKAIKSIRRLFMKNPIQVNEVILNYVLRHCPRDRVTNCGLLLEQIILARSLERFIMKLLSIVEENPHERLNWVWLFRLISLIGNRKKENIKRSLKKLGLNPSVKMIRLTEIHPVKCCQIAYRLSKLRHPMVLKLIVRLRHQLLPSLGKKRTIMLLKLTKIAKHHEITGKAKG